MLKKRVLLVKRNGDLIMVYNLKVAGIERDLPLCPISDELYIGAFVLFGDVELTEKCAEAMCAKAPEHDVMITAESKGIPLICSMARMLGEKRYVLARKSVKLYMKDVVKCETQSITTAARQTLYIDGSDAEYLKGKRVLIVDDVISTGGSLLSLENLVRQAGGEIVGKMAILAEGDAIGREDIIYLAPLPLFNKEGKPL
jgi:adenine phosphoribosyltransferase